METKILTANPAADPTNWINALRVELRTPCVSLEVAAAHLQVSDGMVVRVEHGPRGGWNRPMYLRRRDIYLMRWRPKYSWYIVLRQLPRQAPKHQATGQPKLFL